MQKMKLAICIQQKDYEERFVKCLMHHYKESYEIHVIENLFEAIEKEKKFDVIITEDSEELRKAEAEKQAFLVLVEDMENRQGDFLSMAYYTSKYQEVYKIVEEMEKAITEKGYVRTAKSRNTQPECIGIFSLEEESMQIPFLALLAEILGENHKVLAVDMQPFSGMTREIENGDILGLEDMISVAITENYTLSRLAGSIGHEQKWDYIYPVKNASCLAEGNEELYRKMFAILQKEQGYEQIIINFGTIFPEMLELMAECQQFYFLTNNKNAYSWRENVFFTEMRNLGKEKFLNEMIWMEVGGYVTSEKSWKQMARDWLWSDLGDKLRKINWMENNDG